ncbi:MAG TPA: DUF364 domain-containing protein [Methanothrix sp.]|nr:DUF364 domain-containing protein [Methanothrix sp.]
MGKDILEEAKRLFVHELKSRRSEEGEAELMEGDVLISRPLSPREALGDPGRDDLPVLRGKEVLMQAVFRGCYGQAFTSAAGSFKGTLGDVLDLPLEGGFERAVLISTMNATLRYHGLIEGTVHCKDDGPKRCGQCLAEWIKGQEADKFGLIGMQPALLEAMVAAAGPERVMVSDLDLAGSVSCGVAVLDGMNCTEIFERCQIILITGSALANGTMDGLMECARRHKNRTIFFGTTISGPAYLLKLERWCPSST